MSIISLAKELEQAAKSSTNGATDKQCYALAGYIHDHGLSKNLASQLISAIEASRNPKT